MPERKILPVSPSDDQSDGKLTAGWDLPSDAKQLENLDPTVTQQLGSTPGLGRASQRTDSENTEAIPGEPGDLSSFPEIPGFRIEKLIGQGGMGVVYEATDLELNRVVALKVIFPRGRDASAVRGRFVREVKALAAIEHPNIVPIYHAGQWHGLPYFTMKLVPNGPLSKHISRLSRNPVVCALLMAKVARAVHTLHEKKFVHRDLKPLNILLTEDDEPLVADFGLAKWQDDADSDLTVTGAPIGTRQYMSPEQTLGKDLERLEPCDIWAMGITLYELLAGSRPFTGDSDTSLFNAIQSAEPPPLPRTVPEGIVKIVRGCLAKQPAHRFQTAAEVANQLEQWASSRSSNTATLLVQSTSDASPDLPAKGRSRRRILGTALLGIGAVAAWRFWPARIDSVGDGKGMGLLSSSPVAAASKGPREIIGAKGLPKDWTIIEGTQASVSDQFEGHCTVDSLSRGLVELTPMETPQAFRFEVEVVHLTKTNVLGSVGIYFGRKNWPAPPGHWTTYIAGAYQGIALPGQQQIEEKSQLQLECLGTGGMRVSSAAASRQVEDKSLAIALPFPRGPWLKMSMEYRDESIKILWKNVELAPLPIWGPVLTSRSVRRAIATLGRRPPDQSDPEEGLGTGFGLYVCQGKAAFRNARIVPLKA